MLPGIKVFAEAVEIPDGVPPWLTKKRIMECMKDDDLQNSWEPKVGDWYACVDLYMVMKIESLEGYNKDDPVAVSEHGKDASGRWRCDYYIKEP